MENQNNPYAGSVEFVLDGEVEFHPVAEDLFPPMDDEPFTDLCLDIAANGVLEDIWIHENQIIDGRNRFKALAHLRNHPHLLKSPEEFETLREYWKSVGMPDQIEGDYATYFKHRTEPRYRRWSGHGSLVACVVGLNLKRRHLNESQRAIVAAKLADMRQGERTDLTEISVRLPQPQAAQLLNISVDLLQFGKRVLAQGVPALVQRVESGKLAVSQAATVATLSGPRQQEFVKRHIQRGHKQARNFLKRFKIKTLRGSQDGMRGCLRCDPEAEFTLDNISANMQKLEIRATAYAKTNGTENFASVFNGAAFEAEEIKLGGLRIANIEKILLAIDHGTEDGEKGLIWEGDIMRIAKLTRAEFDDAISNLLEYRTVGFKFQEGKHDKARGAKKKLFFRPESIAAPLKPMHADGEPEDRYYDRDDDFGPYRPLDDDDFDEDPLLTLPASAHGH